MRRKRTNIEKQENVVTILWAFAKDIQTNPSKGCVLTTEDGTKLSTDHVGTALDSIMKNFGYATQEVQ